MSEESANLPAASIAGPVGLVTQSPLAFALILVGLYWTAKILRPVDSSRPPRVPYWIPWVGSAMEIGRDPDEFLSNMTKLLGPVFRVKTLGQEMIFVTSPSIISTVYRDSQNFDFLPVRLEFSQNVFSIPKTIERTPYMLNTYIPDLHHALLPGNLRSMTSTYLASAYDTILSMISSMDGASGPLKTFIVPPAYRAASHAGFGINFPAEESYPYFKVFDESFHMINAGFPKFMTSKAYKEWDKMIDLIEAYIVEQEKNDEEMSVFVQMAMNGRKDGWTNRGIATVLGSQLWALQANAIFAAYWLVALLLQQPDGLAPLVAELDDARRRWKAEYPSTLLGPQFFDDIALSSKALPLLTSAIQKILRYTSSSFSLRQVNAPVTLGGYTLRPSEKVVCATRPVHFDDEIHPQANELNIRRYLEPLRPMKDGKVVPNHSMAFGGGVSMCEGRHFAMIELKVFLSILLTHATIEVDEECATRPEFSWERMGLGIMHPRGDLEVIVRKRKLS